RRALVGVGRREAGRDSALVWLVGRTRVRFGGSSGGGRRGRRRREPEAGKDALE
ncbi:hypothetical protein HPP92_008253, partial [Vanilla planifolia]